MDGADGGGAKVESATTATMALAQKPSRSGLPLPGAGMWLILPSYPLLPGAVFTATLHAHTGAGPGGRGRALRWEFATELERERRREPSAA